MGKRSRTAPSDPRGARGAVLGHVLAASIRAPTRPAPGQKGAAGR